MNGGEPGTGEKKSGRVSKGMLIAILCTVLVAGLFLAKALYDRWNRGELCLKLCYPVRYEEQIRAAAEEFGTDPYLILATMRWESGFDASAVSRAGARGLMQIMPKTGEWIAEELGEAFDGENLFDPETNIRYGSWYLKFLSDRYGGNVRSTAAAYNAGQGRVDKWLLDPEISEGGELVNIPYGETSVYAKRVQNGCEAYRKLYPDLFS